MTAGRHPAAALEVAPVRPESRGAVLAFLSRDPTANLFLMDQALRLGAPPAPGESRSEMIGAWRDGELEAVLALRPSIALTPAAPDVLEGFLPWVEPLGIGLVKSAAPVVDALWQRLSASRPREVVLDRLETAYVLREPEARLAPVRAHERARAAHLGDLDSLVVAARESLRDENRPDPYTGDVRGFRRWVRGRIPRARVVETDAGIVCVGYADVQLPAGWLIQGVYCWPEARRRAFATTGVSDLCRRAFEAGAGHVQLSVVAGNEAGRRLYEGLGFEPVATLRTILFG
jgi:RimJ/RimL family protein N-acetyltransferase